MPELTAVREHQDRRFRNPDAADHGMLRDDAVGSASQANILLPSKYLDGKGRSGDDLLQRLAQIRNDAYQIGLSVRRSTSYVSADLFISPATYNQYCTDYLGKFCRIQMLFDLQNTCWIGPRSLQDMDIFEYLEREYIHGHWAPDGRRNLLSRAFTIRPGRFRPDVGRMPTSEGPWERLVTRKILLTP